MTNKQDAMNSDLLADALDIAAEHDKLKAVNAELLEALENLCDWFDGETCESAHSRIDTARAAIAKAEGL